MGLPRQPGAAAAGGTSPAGGTHPEPPTDVSISWCRASRYRLAPAPVLGSTDTMRPTPGTHADSIAEIKDSSVAGLTSLTTSEAIWCEPERWSLLIKSVPTSSYSSRGAPTDIPIPSGSCSYRTRDGAVWVRTQIVRRLSPAVSLIDGDLPL